MLSDTFPIALAWLLRPDVEGCEVNHPADRGGHTKYGIADAADGKKDGMADLDRDGIPDIAIRDLTPAHTAPFYKRFYWRPASGHTLAQLSPALAIAVFDGAVHHGPARSVKLLQQVLGVLDDGKFGPRSLEQCRLRLASQGDVGLLRALLERRASFMHGIVRKDPSQWANADGWINRLLRLQSYLLSDVVGEVVA